MVKRIVITNPEELDKAAKRRIARERRIAAERVKPAYRLLTIARGCGIIALPGASIDYFMHGLEATYKDKPDYSPVLRLDACGTIQ